ncbi:MAG: hypothetical protein ACI83I_002793 [Bacteroidia bacterium]|jgi:hypothetical protein
MPKQQILIKHNKSVTEEYDEVQSDLLHTNILLIFASQKTRWDHD